ncbi:cytochrome c biogenesis protein DipZ [Lysobacter sp. KIS68-7]|uniref:cytochrome c biogenesis protein DipZ n=1 Tax=Lysobacter sp. KIS68-7 TaxID=2904252 RepID=UPI001E4B43FD|nr:cytochrome c biogenesis protein DipZ [Lysobacter sp. KIS68-7]UHQ19193.1 cytochrome c biogenesis protein DipZ [Lysobacter sp. KIS68-7]
MLLLVLAYLGGALTIVSPCILPVLPFVFARSDQPFAKSGLPLLIGLATTFAAVATLAAVGSQWVVQANHVGRWIALILMAAFALALLWPGLAQQLGKPFQWLGGKLTTSVDGQGTHAGFGGSLLLGIATGLLWAPCAGPILGLVLTGAALQGASVGTTVLLLAYGAGAATSLAIALLIGGRVFAALKRSLGAGEWVRRGLGMAMLVAVVAIATGADTGVLTKISLASTGRIEQHLVDRLQPPQARAEPGGTMMTVANRTDATALPVEGTLPALSGATAWLNSAPLTAESLRGKVVLVDFWTYSCINCLRTLPYVRQWADKYRDAGLVVIGVHAPEFAFERDMDNVRKATKDLGVTYPVAIDNQYAIWRGFNNQYWPAHYFIDAQGRIRAHHFGEGEYDKSEQIIRALLREAGHALPAMVATKATTTGIEADADVAQLRSPETYIGYARAENFDSAGGFARDAVKRYGAAPGMSLNHWALQGDWNVGEEDAHLASADGDIVYRFHARDLHLVLAPDKDGKPIRFRVLIDGKAPGGDHGVDTDASGAGVVDGHRLYQLVRQRSAVQERTFEIRFLDPGVHAYAFTFG